MRPPTCCICMACASGSMPCWRARAAPSWRRPVSTSCRPGPSSISAAGRPRIFLRIRERDRCIATRRLSARRLRPVSVTLVKRGSGLHNPGDPGYNGGLSCGPFGDTQFWSRGEFVTEPSLRRRNGGALCDGRAPQPDGAGAAGRGAGGGGSGDGGHRRGVGLQSVPHAVAETSASTWAISWFPAPRSRWNRRISPASRPTSGHTKCGPRPRSRI